MTEPIIKPIEMDIKSAQPNSTGEFQPLRTFNSYSFERSILIPASPFRFTTPGGTIASRQAIRSGDMVELFAVQTDGTKAQIATGFIDETDTHVTPTSVEYVLTGRDTLGQLVDNAAVDNNNIRIQIEKATLENVLEQLLKNTRIPPGYAKNNLPTGQLLFQTTPGETKIASLQRYLDFANCLIWSLPTGQVKIGQPNFTNQSFGNLILNRSNPGGNNLLEARVKRTVNTAIRKIVLQLQTLGNADPGAYTFNNIDQDMQHIAPNLGGRSVYEVFSYGQAEDAYNQIVAVGNMSGNPFVIGEAKAKREIARENMKIIEVDAVVRGHLNSSGNVFDIDQIYNVQIEDDGVFENMYVYSVTHEMTLDHGMITRLKLVRLGSIVVAPQLPAQT